jgi:plastocyanin
MPRLVALFATAIALSLGIAFAVAAQDQATPTTGAGGEAMLCATPLPETTASPAMVTTVPATAATPCATPTGSPEAGNGVAAQQTVEMIDIAFNPKELTIPANTDVTINLVNKGVTVHNFNIDELNVHSGDYNPGQTGSVTINAAPGTYEYYCSIPGHREAGMVGTLTVQ